MGCEVMNLYDLLGVARDASTEVIRQAFRTRVKKAHPDAGGDRNAWNALTLAHEVLTDANKRAHYDATGEAKSDPENDAKLRARMGFLQSLVMEVVMGRDFTPSDDLLAEAVAILKGKREEVKSAIKVHEKKLKKLEKVIKRWIFKGEGENYIVKILTTQFDGFKQQLERAAGDLEILVDVEKILAEYTFECEEKPKAEAAPGFEAGSAIAQMQAAYSILHKASLRGQRK